VSASHRVCIFLFFLSLPVFPQQPETPARRANERHMTLDVVVTDKAGTAQPGLQQADFTLEDNKQPQTILSFKAVDGTVAAPEPPIEIILVIDRVNTSFQSSANERQQVEKFLRQNDGHLAQPVSLVFFADSGTQLGKTATRDGNALIAAINQSDSSLRTIRRSEGAYGAAERLELSIRALNGIAAFEASKSGKKILIWVSPGWPLLTGPRIDLTAKQHQAVFNEIVAASTALAQARITLYSIDPLGTADAGGLRTTYYQEFVKGVNNERKALYGNLGLQVLATQSGGRVLNSSNDVAGEIGTCIADANAFYVLTFDAPAADGPNEYHALDIKMGRPGLKARTRTLYYAQP
jgi:VWFA-related protein